MAEKEIKRKIQEAIQSFSHGELSKNAISLFSVLGYKTDRQNPFIEKTYKSFKDSFLGGNANFTESKAHINEWIIVDILFQLSKDELTDQKSLFNTNKIDGTIMESYLFLAIELTEENYSRTALSQITREVNKVFKMPVMILFKHGRVLSIAIINRRLNVKDQQKDVLEKVTLIKDIDIHNPHRAHIEILFDLSYDELLRIHKFSNFIELHNAWRKTLDIKELNKRFYRELSNWYFWAIRNVSFPDDIERDENIRNATNLIRLITRVVFIWFLKEKDLIPEKLFDRMELKKILKDFLGDKESNSYYRAILQNLFFGTLNQMMSERGFVKDGTFKQNQNEYGVKTLFRYAALFTISETEVLRIFENIPFLNGGLFDCLDKPDDNGKIIYVDGFSRNPSKQANIPDFLFFGGEEDCDLNEIYGTTNKRYTVKGLIEVLNSYKFTIAENTPIEEEVALDPELLGKVFENLLASYNPETKITARKQTGSFYTPREIVDYMVDESIKAYLEQELINEAKMNSGDAEAGLEILIGYNEKEHLFDEKQTGILINAIDNCKILDPACGSGAFLMGILHKFVHILHKLDPHNWLWKERQIKKARQLDDISIRDQSIENIESAFANNELDYGRKLFLIENCIYGVDIQPIAVQIAKLRIFISLVVDQNKQPEKENLGIRALPNLETKFVSANTLISLGNILRSPEIIGLEEDLKVLRHDYFYVKTRKEKLNCQIKDKYLRKKIFEILKADGWPIASAEQISEFDPYDQNSSSSFFDKEWMFGLIDGFDVVIGNPPYMRMQGLQLTQPNYIPIYREKYNSAQGNFDIYALFVERGIDLVNKQGQLVFILPHKFIQANFGIGLRKLLTSKKALKRIVRFGAEQVFDAATTYTCLLFLSNMPQNSFDLYEVYNLENGIELFSDIRENKAHPDYSLTTFKIPTTYVWEFSVGKNNIIMQKLRQNKQSLGGITRKIFQGIATSADNIYVLKIIHESDNVLCCYSKQLEQEIEIERGFVRPFVMGKDIHRYEEPKPENVVIFPYWIKEGKAVLMTQKEIIQCFPKGWSYLQRNKRDLSDRERGRMHGEQFYAYIYPKNLIEFDSIKIMTPDICGKPEMTIDDTAMLYHTTTIYSFVFNALAKGSVKYYLGIMNSKLIWYFLKVTGNVLRGGYLRFKTDYLKPFPIPEFDSKSQIIIETLVDYILFIKKTSIKPHICLFYECLIDVMVYILYFQADIKSVGSAVPKYLINIPKLNDDWSDEKKLATIEKVYKELSDPVHPVSIAMEKMKEIPEVRIIEGLDKR